MCGGQKLVPGVFLVCSPLYLLRQGFSSNPEFLTSGVYLASLPQQFCLHLSRTGNTDRLPYLPAFLCVLGIRTLFFILAKQTLYPWRHLPGPVSFVNYKILTAFTVIGIIKDVLCRKQQRFSLNGKGVNISGLGCEIFGLCYNVYFLLFPPPKHSYRKHGTSRQGCGSTNLYSWILKFLSHLIFMYHKILVNFFFKNIQTIHCSQAF